VITYEVIRSLIQEDNEAGTDIQSYIRDQDIDPDAVLRVADQMASSASSVFASGVGSPTQILSSLFASGFYAGLLVSQELARA
jgi:hypothetical protein